LYDNARSYFFKAVVIDKTRTAPDLTQAPSIECGESKDPMVKCWALDQPIFYDNG